MKSWTLLVSKTRLKTRKRVLYFLQVRLLLKREMKSKDHFMRSMAAKMYEKFDKYWSTFRTFMAVAVVLDPRSKLEFVEWGCKKVYGLTQEHDDVLTQVVGKVRELYEAYATICTSSSTTNASNVVAGSKVQPIKEDLDELMDVSLIV
ncbi:zinc finger BED domain-containing protein DAYSLEEPER-like [Beta vulgaris subsp. vulgaris]|uniref:zinc finger BED domain-containing protein DAYSLEEPER-like n=1 Tax=Beta vulgaris subsp. vulgaris TaxID=3555 RepID=UPI002036D63C|nr:zinc finger BED domain-containing protein DAYSLEEPER-like [Beta vulgaris subsp. vulgaris]XP_048490409.1 zinc finger BED domain-containing protein DAYSLEEPER-like [Beta vulgaris subsp. vulgaris]